MKTARLTPCRTAVLEVLRASHDHPTAAEILRRVKRRRPGVSCATIYNALGWLTRQGLAAEIQLPNSPCRFDPITSRHDHLICTECGALLDSCVDLPRTVWSAAGECTGFRARDYRLEVYGLCAECAGRAHR